MYVNFVEWAGETAEKTIIGTVRMKSGQLQMEGLTPGLRRNVEEELEFFKGKGDDEAFLRRLPFSFRGSYTWAVFVPEG